MIMPNAAEDMATANMYSVGFALSNTSKKKDVVKKIFRLWSTPEYADLYFRDTPGFPAFDDVDGGSTPYYLADMKEKYIDSDMVSGDFLSKFDSGRDHGLPVDLSSGRTEKAIPERQGDIGTVSDRL